MPASRVRPDRATGRKRYASQRPPIQPRCCQRRRSRPRNVCNGSQPAASALTSRLRRGLLGMVRVRPIGPHSWIASSVCTRRRGRLLALGLPLLFVAMIGLLRSGGAPTSLMVGHTKSSGRLPRSYTVRSAGTPAIPVRSRLNTSLPKRIRSRRFRNVRAAQGNDAVAGTSQILRSTSRSRLS
jgi:hypothetical protein